MRTIGVLAATLGVMFSHELGAQTVGAQNVGSQNVGSQNVGSQSVSAPASGKRSASYSKHHDTRFGHDHFYPDRGALIKAVPKGAAIINYAGLAFRFHDGVWYEPRGTDFMVVAPPIGLVVSSLPTFATLLARNGQTYIYCNDVYYRPRPDINGYEVINDPAEATFQVGVDSVAPESAGDARTADAGTGDSDGPTAAGAIVAGAGGGNAGAASPQPLIVPNSGAYVAPPNTVTAPLPGGAQTAVAALPATLTAAQSAGTGLTNSAPAGSIPASAILVASAGASSVQSKGIKVSLVAKNGQDSDQQARDRYDCYRFAVAQSGFDPMRGIGPSSDYDRAQSACLEGRGYAVQ